MVAAGSRVTAQCTLSVVADYEWDAFGLPDLRGDWYVRPLKIENRQIGYFLAVRDGLLWAIRAVRTGAASRAFLSRRSGLCACSAASFSFPAGFAS